MFLPFVGCFTCGAENLYQLGCDYEDETIYNSHRGCKPCYTNQEYLTKAAICFKKAADQGHLEAKYRLASILLNPSKLTDEGLSHFNNPNLRYPGRNIYKQDDLVNQGRNYMASAAAKGHQEAKKIMEGLDLKIKKEREERSQWRLEAERLKEKQRQREKEAYRQKEEQRQREIEYEQAHPEIPLLKQQNELLRKILQK